MAVALTIVVGSSPVAGPSSAVEEKEPLMCAASLLNPTVPVAQYKIEHPKATKTSRGVCPNKLLASDL